jgi:PiT family inorganic phosphate transporter
MTLSNATDAGLLKSEHPLEKPKSLGNLPNYAVIAILIAGLFYVGYSLTQDLTSAVAVPWILLGLALVTALGFEFVNGFTIPQTPSQR